MPAIPVLLEMDTGFLGFVGLQPSCRLRERPCLSRIKLRWWGRTPDVFLWIPHLHTLLYIHRKNTHTHLIKWEMNKITSLPEEHKDGGQVRKSGR